MKRYSQRLNIISGIKEEIIHRCTEERFKLIKKKEQRQKRKKLVSLLATAAAMLIIMPTMLFVLVPLLLPPIEDEARAPIYIGMTVSNKSNSFASTERFDHLSSTNRIAPLSSTDTATYITLHRPVSGKISKYHNINDEIFSEETMNNDGNHLGIDISASEGAPVYSAASGTVYKIWHEREMGYCMAISHGNDTVTVYKNLAEKLADGIVEGVNVKARQTIASVGNSGEKESANGPHLHFEVIIDDLSVDPLKYFSKDDLDALGVDESYVENGTSADASKGEPTEDKIYYANPGEDVFFSIHFENPDNYTIMAFTLNGVPYASYMFEYGSNFENIIVRVNIGNVEGLVDYTIDAIQYADRETLKYVEMQGDPTLTLGVATAKQPVAEVTDEVVDINEMSFNVTVTDELGLIEATKGNVKAVVMDGDNNIIVNQELKIGRLNKVQIKDLNASTSYIYTIVAEYDALDGKGYSPHILYQKEITRDGS